MHEVLLKMAKFSHFIRDRFHRRFGRSFKDRVHGDIKLWAGEIEEDPSTVSRWLSGDAEPGAEKMFRLLEKFGVDPYEAHDAELNHKEIVVYGKVSAGTVRVAHEELLRVRGCSSVWKHSTYYQFTNGEITYLQVDGTSMEPEYPSGSLIACSRPCNKSLPDLTPVVARVGNECTFKLFIDAGKEIVLLPINLREHERQRRQKDEVAIDYVVLGLIAPWQFAAGRVG